MDHLICINKNSFPAENILIGTQLFNDALQGVLELQNTHDRFLFFLDVNEGNFFDFKISEDLTCGQFADECDPDLASFLFEVDDKSPALDNLSDEQIEEMAESNFYVPDEAADQYTDDYALTWAVSGYLLSISTNERWDQKEIIIARADDQGRYVNDNLTLKNISNQNHGLEHYKMLHDIDLEKIISPHIISQSLLSWFAEQTSENKVRIIDKVRLAYDRGFQGGEPLFKTLTNANGIREIRMSAYAGGAIRILFKRLEQHQQILLVGFIKHGNSEGYTEAIKQSNKILLIY